MRVWQGEVEVWGPYFSTLAPHSDQDVHVISECLTLTAVSKKLIAVSQILTDVSQAQSMTMITKL